MKKGYKNNETQNIVNWIDNTESLYNVSLECADYHHFLEYLTLVGIFKTPDGVSFTDPRIDIDAINKTVFSERN